MKEVYRTFTWTLLLLISVFGGFTANIGKISFNSWSPFICAKVLIVLVGALVLFALPEILLTVKHSIKKG